MEIKVSAKSTKSKQDALHKANSMKLSECVQEFQLSQQFPSMTKQADVTTCENENTALTISNSLKLLPKANCLFPCKKLRIVSSKGRDLGVFNLEVRSDRNSPSKERTLRILKITKSNTLKSVNKPVTISLSSVSRTVPRISPGILEHETAEMSKDKTANVTLDGKHVSNCNLALPRVKSVARPIQETVIRDGNSDTSEDTQIRDNGANVDKNLASNKKKSKSCINNVSCQKYQKIEHEPVVSTRDDKYLTGDIQFRWKIHGVAANNEFSSVLRKESYKKIAESPFPLVKCKKLVVNRDSDHVRLHSEVRGEKYSASSENTENEEMLTPSNNTLNSVQKYRQIDKDLSKRDADGKNTEGHGISTRRNSASRIKNPDFVKLIRENEHISKTKMQKDIMTIVPNHKSLLLRNNTISALGQDTVVSSENNKSMTDEMTKLHNEVTYNTNRIICNNMRNISTDRIPRNDNSSLVDNECVPSEFKEYFADIMNINIQPNEQNVHRSKNEKDLSAQWDIIKTAVSSVKDDELRIQALKALADCGIGIERYIPVHPPEKFKAVHDTQVQTMIFGLLEPKSFVLIKDSLKSIQRISQITFHDTPCAQNMLLENNLHPYNSPSKISNLDEIEPFDIEKFLRESFEENSNTLKMKETLSPINTRYKNILDQLQSDFESVRKYDHNGMLNIHNAIIKNNIYDIQRHLMVLKQCKESVDITTENGVTGLELAIKYDVRSQIVKLLLDAGAQPVISKPAHESALIIASKKSSMLLPMLVKHVSNPKLLDQIDEEGFTTLHYCCINGNLDGVNALISSGANINLQDMKSGRTPVFHALENNHTKIAQILLHAGAVTTAANFAGQTPLLL